jgi:hypothetical protein
MRLIFARSEMYVGCMNVISTMGSSKLTPLFRSSWPDHRGRGREVQVRIRC